MRSFRGRLLFGLAALAIAVAGILVLVGSADVLAQASPFGVGRPQAAPPPPAAVGGVTGWLLAKQAEFYRSLSGLVRAAKADGSAVWGLLGLSFLYGVFHAVGPGHGKAVISSYLVANDETWRRGLVLSLASALLQAVVAVLLVGIAAALLGATAKVMGDTVRWIEIVSYGLIAAVGARLLWVKGRAFIADWRARSSRPAAVGADVAGDHHHPHDGHDHARDPRDRLRDQPHARPHHADEHVHDEHCGHSHGPQPQDLAGAGGWQRGLSAVFAVGLRPCSGAILVLVFALAQGLFWAGVAATFAMGLGTAVAVATIALIAVGAKGLAGRLANTQSGGGTLAIRAVEVVAAALVLAFGVLLLMGYVSSERMFAV
jgi:nickel/cobalt transporter (NicO) family protein